MVVYFVGDLASARHEDPALDALALAWAELAERGAVVLVQRRAGVGRWEYLARRTGKDAAVEAGDGPVGFRPARWAR